MSPMRSFLGLCNVFYWSVPNFASLSLPLNKKLKKKASRQFEYDDAIRCTVVNLKEQIVSPLLLALSRLKGQYTIDAEAYDTRVRYVLLQEHNDKMLKPIGYWFCFLCDTETCYETTHKKYFALVWAVSIPRLYLERAHSTIETCHHAHRWILDLKESTRRLARRRLWLIEFDFTINNHLGLYHQAANAMPRLPKIGNGSS